jgi:hypothetical protein
MYKHVWLVALATLNAACASTTAPASTQPPAPAVSSAPLPAASPSPVPASAPKASADPKDARPPAAGGRPCGVRPGEWCPSPEGDPCGVHTNVAACKSDPKCKGMPYRGESFAPCRDDGSGFSPNCPTVGCISR